MSLKKTIVDSKDDLNDLEDKQTHLYNNGGFIKCKRKAVAHTSCTYQCAVPE